jgi:hypothetical protein
MEPGTVLAAIDLIGKTSKALDSLRERAKTSKDAALKEAISNLYDQFLDLKELVLRITEENAELRRSIAAEAEKPSNPEIRQVGETHYYYVGEDGPLCQPCYDRDGKLVRLMPRQESLLGSGRKCEVCGKVFYEVNKRPPRVQLRSSPWS